jgi:catechol 2,3-dioxygenase-like lactoylglutathione lyase family enzyme
MRFGHVELFVADAVRARDFYVNVLGFELEAENGPPGQAAQFIWVKQGDWLFLLRPGRPAESKEFRSSTANYVIYCDDLEAQAALWRSRGLEFRGDDGPGCLTFTDPDGHWFQLVGPEGM